MAWNANYVYLKHGQTVLIGSNGTTMELPVSATFSVEEENSNGYTAWLDEEQRNNNGGTVLVIADINQPDLLSAANQANFVNKKESSVLTGVTMNVLPFVLLAVVCVVGALVIRKKPTKKS